MERKLTRHRLHRPRIRRRSLPGAMPGSIHAPTEAKQSSIHVLAFGRDSLVEATVTDIAQLRDYLGAYPTCWINVNGLADVQRLQQLGELFQLHALALEDVVNVHQRAKVDPYPSHLFLVARMVRVEPQFHSEQLSMFVGPHFLVTFQEQEGDCLDPLRERLRKNSGRIRSAGSDYLMYAILDAIIDSYFPVVDRFADQLDRLEEEVTDHRSTAALEGIHRVRNELLLLRRNVRPHREAVNELIRDEHPLIQAETRIFLRDCYDHTIQLIDLLEIYREMCADLREYYLALGSNRMNEIMKVLTIISTIFIPLSFVTGLYGMNFDTSSPWNMPELTWRFGYPAVIAAMSTMAATMLGLFWRKGWFKRHS
jgi:magnesium transporter